MPLVSSPSPALLPFLPLPAHCSQHLFRCYLWTSTRHCSSLMNGKTARLCFTLAGSAHTRSTGLKQYRTQKITHTRSSSGLGEKSRALENGWRLSRRQGGGGGGGYK